MAEVAGVASALNPHSELGVHCDLGLPPILSLRGWLAVGGVLFRLLMLFLWISRL